MKKKNKRKICFVITSFIHYSRNFLILEELRKRPDVDLHIAIGGTALISKYSSKTAQVKDILEMGGYKNIHEIHFSLEGDSPLVKSSMTGLGVIKFTDLFNNIKPDLVVVRGDRFEVLSAAVAGSYMNIPIAHIEGGDVSGTLDESVRHAITKLSHLHFPINEHSKERLLNMGEDERFIFNFGSPDIEVAKNLIDEKYQIQISSNMGSGATFDINDKFLMIMFHPVTSELENLSKYTKTLLDVVHEIYHQTLWFWPNMDTGSEIISKELRHFNDCVKDHKIRFMRYIDPKGFVNLLNKASCLIGNSSAGIKETSYLGTPVVNLGNRQKNRQFSENVKISDFRKQNIKKAILEHLEKGRYKSSNLYQGENTAKKIANKLANSKLYIQKHFNNNGN